MSNKDLQHQKYFGSQSQSNNQLKEERYAAFNLQHTDSENGHHDKQETSCFEQ